MGDAGLVVPAYDPDVDALVEYVDALHSLDAVSAVHVEIDAPRSKHALDRLAETPASVYVADQRRGKGAAITHGFDVLDTDVLAFADADGSTPAPSVADVLQAVNAGADLAVGSRRHPNADIADHQTVLRRHLGDGFSSLARHVLDVELHDYQCGVKATTATAWRQLRTFLTEPGFAWDIEVIGFAGHLGFDIREVPVRWEDHEDSTVDPLSTACDLSRALANTWLRTHRSDPMLAPIRRTVFEEPEPLVDRYASDPRASDRQISD